MSNTFPPLFRFYFANRSLRHAELNGDIGLRSARLANCLDNSIGYHLAASGVSGYLAHNKGNIPF